MPVHSEIEIEHVPADSLPSMRHDCRCIAYEAAAVKAIGREVVPARLDDAVLTGAIVCPGDLPSDPDGDVRRIEGEVDDRNVHCARTTRLDRHRAGHRGAMDATDVVVSSPDREYRRGKRHPGVEGRALEHRRPTKTTHLVKEERHVQHMLT